MAGDLDLCSFLFRPESSYHAMGAGRRRLVLDDLRHPAARGPGHCCQRDRGRASRIFVVSPGGASGKNPAITKCAVLRLASKERAAKRSAVGPLTPDSM